MRLNKIFPKDIMNEVFYKFGFERQDSQDGITYANQYNSLVMIYRSRFQTGFFFLDCNAISSYGIIIEGYKRKWDDVEYKECINFMKNSLLPQISKLKGPFKIEPDYYYKKIEELFSKYIKVKSEKGNQVFIIPFRNTIRDVKYNYLKFDLGDSKTIFFLNRSKIYKILISEKMNNQKFYAWYDFADKDKEGDELLSQMVENIAVFLKLKE